MAKYKVGDKVRVRSDLSRYDSTGKLKHYYMENDKRESNTVVDDMPDLAGKIVTITGVWRQYVIKESHWDWTDEMFEGLAEEPEFHIYDTVKHEKYGIGTVIDIGRKSKKTGRRTLKIEFDHWDEDFPNYDENIIWIDSNEIRVVQSYLPN